MNLLFTCLFGLTVLFGTLIVLIVKNNKKISELSVSIAFSVLLFLIFLELIPHTLEHLDYIDLLLYTSIGIISLKLLDKFIPEHEHSSKKKHVVHISLIASIALILHNIIEGMALYSSLESDFNLGILIGIGVGLHNIPMGMIIGSTLTEAKENNKKIIFFNSIISLSTLLGGLIIYLIGNVSDYALGIMLAVTLGMITYIVFFELLRHLKHQNKRNNIIGFILGSLIFLISMLFHTH